MNTPLRTERDYEELSSRLLDVLIRAGMILVIVLLCYRIFSPFLTLMVWALILAVAIYPLHQSLARRMGGRQGLTATVITIIGAIVIVVPSALLLSSLAGAAELEYFVAVTGPGDQILAKETFGTRLDFAGRNRIGVAEELAQRIPLPSDSDPGSYAVLVGFQLTPEELADNRRRRR